MTSLYPLHVCSVVCQFLAFSIALSVGIVYLLLSDHLLATESLGRELGGNPTIHLRNKEDGSREEEPLREVYVMMRIVGAISLAAAVVIFFNLTGVLTLLLGPTSSLVRYCLCTEALRDGMENELVDIMRNRDPSGFRKRLRSTYGLSQKLCRHDKNTPNRRIHRSHVEMPDSRHRGWRSTTYTGRVSTDIRRRQAKLGFANRSSASSPTSASPASDRKKYDSEVRSQMKRRAAPAELSSSPRRRRRPSYSTHSTTPPSESPKEDTKKYRKDMKKAMMSTRSTQSEISAASASPSNDRKKYSSNLDRLYTTTLTGRNHPGRHTRVRQIKHVRRNKQ